MNIIVNYWPRVWQSVSFDSDLGNGRVRWLSRKPKQCAGWALKHNGSWYVIWSSGEHLIFQVGTRKWPVTDVYRCCNILQGDTRTFTILRKNEIVFELKYKAYDNDADQTFDNLDLELSDFFYWVAGVWNNSGLQTELTRSWKVYT